tara:strand:- start:5552 stop:5863 length:312 start_codon:yes stop_codon:yes gene_type:complete
MPFRQMPEIFDSINVIVPVGEELEMVDPHVMKVAHVESIVDPERIGVNNAVWRHFSSMIGSMVSVLALGIMEVKPSLPLSSNPNAATFPDASLLRFPLRVPPK